MDVLYLTVVANSVAVSASLSHTFLLRHVCTVPLDRHNPVLESLNHLLLCILGNPITAIPSDLRGRPTGRLAVFDVGHLTDWVVQLGGP